MRSSKARVVTAISALAAVGMLAWLGVLWLREERAIASLASPDESVRIAAAESLARMGCVRAIPALLEAARREPLTMEGRFSFQALLSRDPPYVFRALDALTIPRALPVMLQLLRTGDPEDRVWVAGAIGRLQSVPEEAFEPLSKLALPSEDLIDAGNPLVWPSLLRFGSRAVPTFLQALRRKDYVAMNAMQILPCLGPLVLSEGSALASSIRHIRRQLVQVADDLDAVAGALDPLVSLDPAVSRVLLEEELNDLRRGLDAARNAQDRRFGLLPSIFGQLHVAYGKEWFAAVRPVAEEMLADPRSTVSQAGARLFALATRAGWEGPLPERLFQVATGLDDDSLLALASRDDADSTLLLLGPAIRSSQLRALEILRALMEQGRAPRALPRLLGEAFSAHGDLPCADMFLLLAAIAPAGADLLHYAEDMMDWEIIDARAAAACALACHGRSGEAIRAALWAHIASCGIVSDTRRAILEALARSREDGARALFMESAQEFSSACSDWHEPLRIWGTSAISLLAQAARSERVDVHRSAMEALVRLELVPEDSPVLRTLLADSEPEVRAWAAFSLGKLGPAAAACESDLQRLLDDPELAVRVHSATALAHIQPASRLVAARLEETLRSLSDVGTGEPLLPFLADALVRCRLANPPALLDLLTGTINSMTDPVWRALGKMGAAAKAIAPALVTLARDKTSRWRRRALETIPRIDPDPSHVPVLLDGFADVDDGVSRSSAEALFVLGPGAAGGVDHLLAHIRRSDRAHEAAVILSRIGVAAVSALTSALSSEDPDVRAWAAWSLGGIGAPALGAVRALVAGLGDPSATVRAACAEALGRIGPVPEPVQEALEALARDSSEAVRRHALCAAERLRAWSPAPPRELFPDPFRAPPGCFSREGEEPESDRFHASVCRR